MPRTIALALHWNITAHNSQRTVDGDNGDDIAAVQIVDHVFADHNSNG